MRAKKTCEFLEGKFYARTQIILLWELRVLLQINITSRWGIWGVGWNCSIQLPLLAIHTSLELGGHTPCAEKPRPSHWTSEQQNERQRAAGAFTVTQHSVRAKHKVTSVGMLGRALCQLQWGPFPEGLVWIQILGYWFPRVVRTNHTDLLGENNKCLYLSILVARHLKPCCQQWSHLQRP